MQTDDLWAAVSIGTHLLVLPTHPIQANLMEVDEKFPYPSYLFPAAFLSQYFCPCTVRGLNISRSMKAKVTTSTFIPWSCVADIYLSGRVNQRWHSPKIGTTTHWGTSLSILWYFRWVKNLYYSRRVLCPQSGTSALQRVLNMLFIRKMPITLYSTGWSIL